MKKAALLVTLLCIPALAAQSGSAQTTARNVDTAIKAIADEYTKASLAGDAKAIANLYTEDAIEMPPNQPPVKGRAAIQQHYEKLFKGMKVSSFTLDHLESRSSGDIGFDAGTYRQTVTPTGAAGIDETGKFVVIVKRTGGAWKIAYAIYNSDRSEQTAHLDR